MVHELSVIYENINQNVPDFNSFSPHLNVWDLLPVVILCSLTIIFTLLWLTSVWMYLLRTKKHLLEPYGKNKQTAEIQQNQVESERGNILSEKIQLL